MKLIFPIVALAFFCAVEVPAQPLPFPVKDAEWVTAHYDVYCTGGSTRRYLWREYLGTDTLMDNVVYHRVLIQPECIRIYGGSHCQDDIEYYTGGPTVIGGLREENRKVYFHKFSSMDFGFYESAFKDIPDTTDVLLYDFNWKTGDTAVIQRKTGNPFKYEVVGATNGGGRKIITLKKLIMYYYNTEILEGMGEVNGLFGLYYTVTQEYYHTRNVCFYHNGVLIQKGEDCDICGVVGTDLPLPSPIKIYPNPAGALLHIETDPEFSPVALRIFDLTGHLQYFDPEFSAGTLPIGALDLRGWLQVHVTDRQGRTWTGRVFVMED